MVGKKWQMEKNGKKSSGRVHVENQGALSPIRGSPENQVKTGSPIGGSLFSLLKNVGRGEGVFSNLKSRRKGYRFFQGRGVNLNRGCG